MVGQVGIEPTGLKATALQAAEQPLFIYPIWWEGLDLRQRPCDPCRFLNGRLSHALDTELPSHNYSSLRMSSLDVRLSLESRNLLDWCDLNGIKPSPQQFQCYALTLS